MRCPLTQSVGNTLFVVSWVMGTANRVKGRAVVILSVDATRGVAQWVTPITFVCQVARVQGFLKMGSCHSLCPHDSARAGLVEGMPCTQCKVLDVGKYSDPTFGPF